MRFRNQGDDLVYCTPDEQTLQHPDLIAEAARIEVRLLYPMSGLETEEPIATWQGLDADAARLVWESSTGAVKLGDFAEEFFRRLADRLGRPMLLRKGELHRLVELVEPASIPAEVTAKLDLLADTFGAGRRGEDA
ncbi:MAG: hypothetical protein OXH69_00900 [Acidobacteria bacterium]|nr:hypothetical protein [Acidobacteriota bacterium]